ncbi:MAG: hypothetical protein F4157_06425, partial [Synechococcus sp. SB0675_bin_6]|nr:hypothetical protein [Synechococcus sp. SB0675_bin_6]
MYASPLPPADLECTTSYPCYDYYPTVEADDTYDIIITATTDSTSENDETITIYWMDDNLKLIGTIEITIKDGQRPGVTVSESTLALTEGGAVKAYTVKPATDPGTGTTVVVTPTSADTTAVTVSPGSHSFTGGSSGTWKTAKTFTVTAIEDGDTTGETVNITHGVTNYGTVTSAPMVVVTVTDAGKGVLVSRSALSVKENGGEGKYTLRLKSQPASGTVTLSVTSDDTAKATVSPASLAFNTTNWSSLQTVTVTGVADGSATVSHAVASADDTTNYPTTLTIPGVAVTVADLPEVSIEPKTNTNPVTEGTAAVFTVTRAGGVGGTTNPVTVTLRVADAPNSDFVAPANEGDKTVDIPAGTATVDFSVDTETDSTDEPDGPVTVTVQPDPGYTISSAMGSATRTVNDDDTSGGGGGGNGGGTTPPPPPTVSISGGSAVTEGEAAVFTLSHSGRVMSALTVLLAVSENEAEGQDFVTPANEGNRRVVIPAGATTTTYRVSTNDDAVDEPDGAVTVALRDSTAYTTGAAATVTVVVTDDDESSPDMPVVSITAGDSVTEGMPAVFTLTATPAPAAGTSITVNLAVAESGSFVASSHTGSRSVTIGTEGTASFTVATEDDNAYEPAGGSITATVEGGTGYLPHADDATAVVTVADNDKVASANAMALQGWHSRMGRTVSQQVVDALQHRFSAPPTPSGLHLTMAGEELNGSSATPLVENQQVLSKALGFETVTAQQLVQGSSFSFSPEGGSANFAFWG